MGIGDFSKIPNGGPGVESRQQLVYDGGVRGGRITLNRMVDLLSTSPAKLFGLLPRKGTIAVGRDADIVVFDPDRITTLSVGSQVSRVDYCTFEGRKVHGVPGVPESSHPMVRRRRRVADLRFRVVARGGSNRRPSDLQGEDRVGRIRTDQRSRFVGGMPALPWSHF